MEEMWLDIKDYEGHYQVSNTGKVRSLKTNRILKPRVSGQYKYFSVSLCKNGKPKDFYIHRLVASHYIDNPENKYSVNHIDGNKMNNNVSNLEWATGTEQNNHAFRLGLKHSEHHSKLTREQVNEIRKTKGKLKDIAKIYGVSDGLVSMIRRNKIWRR